ncbi:S-adenosylmethionine:tRNA ribosyltransferase-isomerase, partial [Acinetobacter baumannii]|uniref:S-adenosylmethionine:tRNA ribosyltransferase-isomerase n=1 Tax=Acinetobacter baumannii TaxID=470 RepID=UPI000AB9321B
SVKKTYVTLHDGAGNFIPASTDDIKHHVMKNNRIDVSQEIIELIMTNNTRENKMIAVRITATHAFDNEAQAHGGKIAAWTGETQIFIYPGYEFCIVDR